MAAPLPIWRLSDGRRGHDNQSLGLVEALAELVPLEVSELAVRRGLRGAAGALRRAAQPPRLVVGAGHATHLSLIVAARRHRARSVVLMNPSVPRSLFDLCIIPAHDGVPARDNVLTSLGALNRVRPGGPRDASAGLVLVGGPSRHHRWDEDALLAGLRELMAGRAGLRWVVAGSPRTPATTLAALEGLQGVQVVPFAGTAPGWLPATMARSAQVWVTEDSVSMAYEAASCGAATGILPVPARRRGRVQAAVRALLDAGLAVTLEDWRNGAVPAPPAEPLQEARRCARAMLTRWPDLA